MAPAGGDGAHPSGGQSSGGQSGGSAGATLVGGAGGTVVLDPPPPGVTCGGATPWCCVDRTSSPREASEGTGLTYRRGCDDAVDCPGQRCFADMFASVRFATSCTDECGGVSHEIGVCKGASDGQDGEACRPCPCAGRVLGLYSARAPVLRVTHRWQPRAPRAAGGTLAARSDHRGSGTTPPRPDSKPLMPGLARAPCFAGWLLLCACAAAPAPQPQPPLAPPAPADLAPSLVSAPPPLAETAPFELVSATPEGELAALPPAITLVFSRPVQPIEGSLESPEPVARVTTAGGAELAGRWLWYGTRTASFEFRKRAPWASEIEVVVPAATRALDGTTLGADRAFGFATPRPALLAASVPDGFVAGRGYPLRLFFNQPVSRGEARRVLSVSGTRAGRRVPIPFTVEQDDLGDDWVETDQRLLLPRIPDGVGDVVVEVAAGLRGAEGTRVSLAPARFPLPTLGPLRFTVECERAPDGRCAADSCPTLTLSKPVPTLALYQHLRFEPEVPKDRYAFEGSTDSIPLGYLFEPAPGGRYRVEVRPGFVTEDGERITRGQRFELAMADETPSVEWTTQREVVIERGRPAPFLRLWGLNVASVDAALAPITAQEAAAWLGGRGRDYAAVAALPLAREVRLPLSVSPNERARADLPLPPELFSALRTGGLLVATRGEGATAEPARLVTVTDLGVLARWSPHGTIVWVTRLSDALPVAGAQVTLTAAATASPPPPAAFSTRTDRDGLAVLPAHAMQQALGPPGAPGPVVTVTHGEDHARVVAQRLDRESVAPLPFVFVERGIYQPGEPLHVKGYLRQPALSGLETPVGQKLEVIVRDDLDRVLFERRTRTDDYGSFAVEGTLPETAALGFASVEVRWRGAPPGWSRDRWTGFVISRYRVLDFEVKARLDRETYLRGDTARLSVLGRYFHGATMRDVPLRIEVSAYATTFRPTGFAGYTFGGADDGSRGGTVEAQRRLDGQGRARFEHPLALPGVKVPVTVEFDAEVADVSRRFAIADRATALVHPAAFYVGLRPDDVSPRYPGRPIAVEVVAATPDGAPQAGAAVTVELVPTPVVEEASTPARARPSPALERCQVMTGAEPRRCVFTPAREGDFQLRAASVDARGNPVVTALDLQVLPPEVAEWRPPREPEPEPEPEVTQPPKDEPRPRERLSFADWCRHQSPSAELDVVRHDQPWRVPSRFDYRFEERRWELGDTVFFCIVSPALAPALVTLERDAILEREVVWLRAGGNLRRIPVTDRLFPYATLRVTSARPPVAGRSASEEVATELWVDSGHKALDVSLRLPRRARPGEKLRLEVTVERNGRPTAAQVTLWAVDAGVLALRHYDLPEPFRTFAERMPTPLESSDNRRLLYWPTDHRRSHEPRVRMGATHVGPPGAVPVRERFPAVAWYRPDLRLDASGKATLELPLPDNATRWHVFAVAATRDDAFGGAERTFETSQELLLRPRLPRVSRVGDRLRAAVVVDSTLPMARDVEVELTVTGALTGTRRATVRLPARGHRELDLELMARRPGVATFMATARSGALRDAVRIEHRVTQPMTFTTAVVEGVTEGVAWERLGSLAAARPDAGGLTLTLSSSPFAGLGEVARALETYPYGCTEQLVSRLVPSLLLTSGGERLGVESGLDRADLEEAIATLHARQQPDGGFGYWTRSDGSELWLTGYALLALLRARAAGLPVSARAIGTARRYLERLPLGAETTAIAQAWLEDVLATAGAPRRDRIAALAARPAALGAFGRVLLAHAAAVAGDRALGRSLLDASVAAGITLTGATGQASLPAPEPYASSILRSTARDTALLVRALALAWPEHPALPRLVAGLLAARRDGRYATTQDGAWALLALDEAARAAPPPAELTARVWLDGAPVMQASLAGPAPRSAHAELPLSRLLAVPDGRLAFASEGGPLYYQAILRTADRGLPAQPRSHSLSIERAAAPAAFDGSRRPATTRFALGDWVELSAVVTTPVPREQVALVLPLPTGLEAIDPLHASTARIALAPGLDDRLPSHVERHDDRVELFFDHLPAGASHVAELARATIAGEFGVPPATVECLYAPDVRGSTGVARVTVAGGG